MTIATFFFVFWASWILRSCWHLFFGTRLGVLRSWMIIGLILAMTSCQKKPNAKPATGPIIIYADTARTKLVHRANASADSLTIIHDRTNQTVTSYGNSVHQFDSIQVALP